MQLTHGGLAKMIHHHGQNDDELEEDEAACYYLHVLQVIKPIGQQQRLEMQQQQQQQQEEESSLTEEEEEDNNGIAEEVSFDPRHCYRLVAHDGTNSYDELYLDEDYVETTLDGDGQQITKNILLKVSDFIIIPSTNNNNEQRKPLLKITNASVVNNPKHKHSVAFRCWNMRIVDWEERIKPDFSKQLLWRIDDPKESFSDFAIIIRNEQHEQTVYHVHKIILAFRLLGVESGYFATLFHGVGGRGASSDGTVGQFKEATETKKEICISLDSWQARGFPIVLDYLYSGKVLPDDDETIDKESASLLFLADYFQISTLVATIMKRLNSNLTNLEVLSKYYFCIMVSQHIDGMKTLYSRAVFLVVEGVLLSLAGDDQKGVVIDELLPAMDTTFLLRVLQYLQRLTHVHNLLMKKYFNDNHSLYTKYKYVTSTIVQKFILAKHLHEEGNDHDGESFSGDLTKDDFHSLTNEEHMPFISPDVAQFLLDVDTTLKSKFNDGGEESATSASSKTLSSSLQKRCRHALDPNNSKNCDGRPFDGITSKKVRPGDWFIKIITVEENDPLNVGRYKLCKQRANSERDVPYDDFYYTNSTGFWKERENKTDDDDDDDATPSGKPAIFHLYHHYDKWSLMARESENSLLSLSQSGNPNLWRDNEQHNLGKYEVLPPVVGWWNPKTQEPFFLVYYLDKEESDDDGDFLPQVL